MQLQFAFKNMKITGKEEEYAREKFEKAEHFADVRLMHVLVEFFPSLSQVEAIKVSVTTELKNGEVVKNEESGSAFTEAVDKVQEEIVRSVRKIKEKLRTQKIKGRVKAKQELMKSGDEV